MRITYNDELNRLLTPYVERLLKNKSSLNQEMVTLFDHMMEDCDMINGYGIFGEKIEPRIKEIIREENIECIANLCDGKLDNLFRYMLGDEYAGLFKSYLKLEANCPHTSGYARLSQRSTHPSLHLEHVREAWIQFLKLRASGFNEQAILNGGNNSKEIEVYNGVLNSQYWIAAHIAQGNETVIGYLHNVLTSENNANRLSREHLHAIAISGYFPLLELEGKLLLAARLQEGLRQAIVETMDEGCPESYLYLLSVIYDNNLQRFASVKRSIAVSTGIGEQDSSERVTNKYIELIRNFLNNIDLARKALQSKDTVELYLALWSIGFYNTEEIKALVPGIIKNGAKHQVQTLLYFLNSTQTSDMSHRISKEAFEVWHEDPSVVTAILPIYLGDLYFSRYSDDSDAPVLNDYFDSPEEAIRHYGYLKQLYQAISAKEVYSPYIFPWAQSCITRPDIVLKMAYIAWILNSCELKDELCTYLPQLETYTRANYIGAVMKHPTSKIQQDYILQSLGDRSSDVREEAYKVLSEMNLTHEQYLGIEELLRFKYSEMRINIISLLMRQPKDQLAGSIQRLLADKVAERRLAGLDMMKTIHHAEDMQDIFRQLIPSIKEIQRPSTKEKVLIESLIGDGTEEEPAKHYSRENGFGLYDPSAEIDIPPVAPDAAFNVKKAFEFIRFGKAKVLFERLNKYIEKHKNVEFLNKYGEARLVSESVLMGWYNNCEGLNELGLPELWGAFYEVEIRSYEKLLMMKFMLASTDVSDDLEDEDEDDENDRKAAKESLNSFESLINQMYAGITYRGFRKELSKLPYFNQINDIVQALEAEYREEKTYQRLAANMLLQLLPRLNSQNIFRQYTCKHTWLMDKHEYGEKVIVYPIHNNKFVQFWLDMPQQPMDDILFARYFTVRYHLYKLTNYMGHKPELEETNSYLRSIDFVRAWMLELIPEEEIYRELMGRVNSPERIEDITLSLYAGSHRPGRRKIECNDLKDIDFSACHPLIQKVIDRILEIELKRGDSETQVTKLAEKLERIYGAQTLILILQAFGKDGFIRDSYNWKSTKRGVLSSLLHSCHPLPSDTSDTLKELAGQAGITDERLVEAAMFAPQWIELTEKATGWKGLTSAAYYFHAHTCETFDDQKKAIIARYTPIDVEDLREGAFDIDWFKDAYKTLGKQRFEVVYNAAKYISSSNNHTRARKFADAVNGTLKAPAVKKEIIAKRNKDLLMSYGLIPLGKKAEKEVLERYQYLQKFLKESKEFGAQRQESEKKAVSIALQNLALNSGYGDVTRLTWSMETELIKEILPYLTPKVLDGIEMYVQISDEGKSEIKLIRAGKELNSLPAKLKKHSYVDELKTVHKKLKDQYTRSRIMLEQAMEDCIRFKETELSKLMKNPVVWPLLKNLVFTSNGRIGFYTDGLLITADSVCIPLTQEDELRIAHPIDLYANGNWHAYQKLLFDKAIRQPFKQVFRELYIPTSEEAKATQSRRYAGNQIQTRKTVSILKGRRWIADYENGLQKVYYKDNIIASIYAMADWFSPADIEAPTLEFVCFHNRKDFTPMKISEVPPVIFSEVMRDVDLAVSVAHSGSVDPETSHSTIEIRRALVGLTLPLFHISNVKVTGNFAHIEGKLGRYNIHLGSGVIHQEGGAQIAVLPVHSQNRGRLFLPFVDEDPKTAEILTKILLFAEDEKIKDPSILMQIKRQ